MKMYSVITAVFMVMCAVALAHAAHVDLEWTYEQNPDNLATHFVMQRCVVVDRATGCADFTDLPDGKKIPVDSMVFSDLTISQNVGYCYAVLAENDVNQRSKPSDPFCAGDFVLNAPGALRGTVR